MKFLRFSFLVCFLTFGLSAADEQSYIFEAKGEFAKELKNLVEKYSKDGNTSITVYEGGAINQSQDNGSFLNVGVSSKRRYSASKGAEIYAKNCASCHGEKGEKRAYGRSKRLSEISADDIEMAFSGYLNDPEYGGNMRDLMKPVAATTTYNDLGAIIAFLKGENALANSNQENENKDVATTPTQGSYLK